MAEGYGQHPSSLSGLSDEALIAMYRGESWFNMNEQQRLELLQETVNRSAQQNGELGSCRVAFSDDLGPGVSGVQSGDQILLSRERYVMDMGQVTYGGRTITVPLTDSNMQALETVLHEDQHAWQNQVIDGTVPCSDPQLLREYMANNFDVSLVRDGQGACDVGQQYLSGAGNGGYYLYYLQSTERDAFRISQARTMEAAAYLEQHYGQDGSLDAYRQSVAANGYEATLQQAQRYFGTETVEEDINTTLQNQFYHEDKPVSSPVVEEAVKQEMVLSFQERMGQAGSMQARDGVVTAQTGPKTTEEQSLQASEPSAPAQTPEVQAPSISEAGIGSEGGGIDGGTDGGIE